MTEQLELFECSFCADTGEVSLGPRGTYKVLCGMCPAGEALNNDKTPIYEPEPQAESE